MRTCIVSKVQATSLPAKAPASRTPDPVLTPRILEAARRLLFTQGVAGMTMDALADELGMSKKTLYVHFPSKDALLGSIVQELADAMHRAVSEVLANTKLNCTERLCTVIDTIGTSMSRISPAMLRDLQRNAPAVYEKIDSVRRSKIPLIFGRIIRDGIADGTIRGDINPDFTTEFWLQAVRGMLDPETLQRTQLSQRQTLEQGVALFFQGLLSPAGRGQFQAHRQNCTQHGLH